ncbi:MAG: hypothetical protein E7198_05450 [Schwartzia succinivorans]|jgi:hypothetical protein|uniref:hypothetical protein n=1 Tax=Schwartzia succinivorans TaxID=55507 RepID=UPI0023554FED|nr:hypothetical protein [Schwartzia succinivorans]MBE6097231.1 hypothetical protein [Schwartzia succinivorans]
MADKEITATGEKHTDILESKLTPLAGFDKESAEKIAPLMGSFMKAYAGSEQDGEGEWLYTPLKEALPERSDDEIANIRKEIHASVTKWNADMESIREACADGKTKEEWLEGKLQEAAIGVNVADYGAYLAETSTGLHLANQEAIEGTRGLSEDFEEGEAQGQEWDASNTHELAIQLGKEVEVSSLAGTVLRTGWEMAEKTPLGEEFQNIKKVADALRSGEDQGVKEAASAALKSGLEKGYIPFLPKNTPTPIVSGLACMGVEHAKIMLQFADGDISGGQAINLMGRAATVHASNVCCHFGEKIGRQVGQKLGMMVGAVIPVLAPVGMAVGGFVGGVVGRIGGSVIGKTIGKAVRKVAEVAKPVLKSAWEGIKSVGRTIMNGIKSLFSIFS